MCRKRRNVPMRRAICILVAFLIPLLAADMATSRLAVVCGSMLPSEGNADGDGVPADGQDPAGAGDARVVSSAPAAPHLAVPRFSRLRVAAARGPRLGPVRAPALHSSAAPPLRC